MRLPILANAIEDGSPKVSRVGLTLGVASMVLVGLFVWLTSAATIIITSALLAVAMRPFTSPLERRGLTPDVSAAMLTAILTLAALVLTITLAPRLASELQHFSATLSIPGKGLVPKLQSSLGLQSPVLGSEIVQAQIERTVATFLLTGLEMVSGMLASFLSLCAVILLTLLFLRDGQSAVKRLVGIIPNRYFEATIVLIHSLSARVGDYLRVELLLAIMTGALASLAFRLLGMPFPLLLGLVAGLASMTPYFGVIFATVLAATAVVLMSNSLAGAIVVVVALATIHVVRGLVSASFSRSSLPYLRPLTTVVSMLLGAHLIGLVGILVAAPLVSLVRIFVTETILVAKRYRI